MGMFIILTVVKFHKCKCVSKLIKEHSKYMQQINVSYASMKQFLKNTYTQPFEGFSLRELSHKSISTHLVACGPLIPLLHFSPIILDSSLEIILSKQVRKVILYCLVKMEFTKLCIFQIRFKNDKQLRLLLSYHLFYLWVITSYLCSFVRVFQMARNAHTV